MTFFQIILALAMIAIAAALIIWLRGYLAQGSDRRMKRMLESVGLDPAIADSGDNEVIMKEVRRRCRRCTAEDLCERWQAGEHEGDNTFCPNAKVFEYLKQTAKAA